MSYILNTNNPRLNKSRISNRKLKLKRWCRSNDIALRVTIARGGRPEISLHFSSLVPLSWGTRANCGSRPRANSKALSLSLSLASLIRSPGVERDPRADLETNFFRRMLVTIHFFALEERQSGCFYLTRGILFASHFAAYFSAVARMRESKSKNRNPVAISDWAPCGSPAISPSKRRSNFITPRTAEAWK